MQMNTSAYIPYDCVSPIIVKNEEYPDYPFFHGTGFFVQFKPHDYVFFITAKHCTHAPDNNELGYVKVAVEQENCTQQILFKECLMGGVRGLKIEDLEDIVIYVVDDSKKEQMEALKKRCIRLIHQQDVDTILDMVLSEKRKLRTVGFPATSEKVIDYASSTATAPSRGFYGNVTGRSEDGLLYTMENLNWKDNDGKLDGFSGSPVIEFLPERMIVDFPPKPEDIEPVPVGIIVMGSNGIAKFLTINVVTNIIAGYINAQRQNAALPQLPGGSSSAIPQPM